MRWREGGESARETTIATMVTLGEVEIKLVFSRINNTFLSKAIVLRNLSLPIISGINLFTAYLEKLHRKGV